MKTSNIKKDIRAIVAEGKKVNTIELAEKYDRTKKEISDIMSKMRRSGEPIPYLINAKYKLIKDKVDETI